MNWNKKLNLTDSKSKAQWRHMGFILGLIVTLGILNFGCDNGNETNSTNEYYVKYEVNSSTIYMGGKLNVTIITENNTPMTITIDQGILWETIIGPVQKGFLATLLVNASTVTSNEVALYTNIYVSKNNSPFALKKSYGSDTPRNSVQISYTIDY
jgi:hypothetical protein